MKSRELSLGDKNKILSNIKNVGTSREREKVDNRIATVNTQRALREDELKAKRIFVSQKKDIFSLIEQTGLCIEKEIKKKDEVFRAILGLVHLVPFMKRLYFECNVVIMSYFRE